MEKDMNDESLRPAGEIIPPELAVRAMRDSGYRNTAYALAELIDNSIQAGAKAVEVVCVHKRQLLNKREVPRMTAIAVIDDGEGMSPETLRLALQFGNGTRFDRKGMGRFGMGLPNSSISQCRRLEVWTWQNGPDNAMHTYLDVNEIEKRLLYSVPVPSVKPIPKEWRKRSEIIGTTGTLVLWTDFEEHRLTWRGAKTTLKNTEEIVGRMYRKFIDDGRAAIRLLALDDEGKSETVIFDQYTRVNDPLYLMQNSSTPAPFGKEPMFQKWGEGVQKFPFEYKGEDQKITVRMSWAREKTLPESGQVNRGDQPYGRHAKKNMGLSIVRAGRELDLDAGWIKGDDPIDRWWGVEVEFDPALDELFGVTNNKQSATVFSQMAKFDWQSEAEDDESQSEFEERLMSEGDPRALLFKTVNHIKKQINEVRKKLKEQAKDRRPNKQRHNDVEDEATKKNRERAERGHKTEQDDQTFGEKERAELERDLIEEKDYSEDIAKEIAQATFDNQRNVIFVTKMMEGYAFFNIEHKHGGLTQVVFNNNHPFYRQLYEALEPEIGEETDSDLIERINKASETLKLLFAAWARYEMEETEQEGLSDMRQEWGKMARFFLTKSSK